MSPEKRVDHINTDNLNHSGDLDGAMQELPREGVPSVQHLDTGEIEQILPEHSGELELHDDERPEFQEKLAELRASHVSGEAPAGYIPTEHLSTPEQPKGRGKLYAAIGGVAATAVTAVSLFLLPKGENTTANQPAPTQPVATAEATQSEAPAPVETKQPTLTKAEQIASHEIKTGQTDEALMNDVVGKLSEWGMAGANKEAFDKFAGSTNASIEKIADDIAAEQGDIYATAIFGPNYKENPQVAQTVATLIKTNADNIRFYIRTYDPQYNPKNIERWNRQLLPDKLQLAEPTANGKRLMIDVRYKTNADKTYFETDAANGTLDRLNIELVDNHDNTYTASAIRFIPFVG